MNTPTTLQDIRDARSILASELSLLDTILATGTAPFIGQALAKQTQKVEDKSNTLKHLAKRFEEGI